MNPGVPRGQPGAARRHETVLESVEEIRTQVRNAASREADRTSTGLPQTPQVQDTQPFRPQLRPPMALLCVLDDGDDSGEMVRIRAGSFVIGRVEGDLILPHDAGISGRHAEISRRVEHGAYAWSLKDLQSTNGTFVRASTVLLSHDQEVLIGGRRVRFEAPSPMPEPAPAPAPGAGATLKWNTLPAAGGPATLVEVAQGRDLRRFPLTEPEHWLGRDPRQCSIVLDDPMIDRRHARIFRDDRNRWVLANARSLNGVWARIQEVALGRGGFFQCGEQRFVVKVL